MDAPNIVHGDLYDKNFTNPIDLVRLNHVLQDGLHLNLLKPNWTFVASSQNMTNISRNPFAALVKDDSQVLQHTSNSKQASPELSKMTSPIAGNSWT